jgi:hypothetical protein
MVVGRESSRQYAKRDDETFPPVCLREIQDWNRKHLLSFDVPEGGKKTLLERTLPNSGCWTEFRAYGQIIYRFDRPLTQEEVARIDNELSRLEIQSWEYGEYGSLITENKTRLQEASGSP